MDEDGNRPGPEAAAAAGPAATVAGPLPRSAARDAAVVYLTAAFALVAGHFLTRPKAWPAAARALDPVFFGQPWLADLAWWALTSTFFYVVPATVVSAAAFRRGPRSLGLGLGSLPRHAWIYAVLLLGVLPLVYLSSLRRDFQWTYPFNANVGLDLRFFLAWEALYVLQFFGLESFFRGFLLFPLEKSLGPSAVFVMTVPYAMIHFEKPFLEANAAVFAGLILGFAALRTRSVWGGVLLHGTVAVTMDVLALSADGRWPPGALP
ncbi:MAG: CPBP family intramembrane metalloprotease [Planctomycetes bacterium]|jgi:membrane protease YdiL (CAAX protease family)|nr:CPBP family intramembrane metalloprotease [Planctomycetota bacterium]